MNSMLNSKKKVLVIDNDSVFIDNLKRDMLLSPDMEFATSSNTAVEGFGLIKTFNPDILIVTCPLQDADISMFLSSIPRLQNQIRIAAAPPGFEGLQDVLLKNGLVDYAVKKPYNTNALQDIVLQAERKRDAFVEPKAESGIYTKESDNKPVQNSNNFMLNVPPFANPNMNPAGFNPQANMYPQNRMPQVGSPQGMPINGQIPNPQSYTNPYPYQYPNFNQQTPVQNFNDQSAYGGFRTLKKAIIAVDCPKGGVGKSTIAKELAVLYSATKVNGQPLRVLLVDSDIEFGDIGNMLMLKPYPTLVEWTSDIRNYRHVHPNEIPKFSEEQVRKYLSVYEPTGLNVLMAPANHAKALEIKEEDCRIVYDSLLACNFDIIIFDCGNNTNTWTISAYEVANYILMVLNTDVTTLSDTMRLMQTLTGIIPREKIKFIINSLPPQSKIDTPLADIKSMFQGQEFIGCLPDIGNEVRRSNNSGKPIVLGRNNEFTNNLKKIANYMVPVFGKRALSTSSRISPKTKGGGLLGFFRK